MKRITSDKFNRDWQMLLLSCAVAILTMTPMWINGVTTSRDAFQHYQSALTYYNSAITGDFYPGLATAENNGYSGYGVRFYPPLSYWVLASARFITGSWYDASYLAFSFWMVLASIGIYLWAREWLSPEESMIAAGLFSVAPYHIHQIYNLLFYPEFAACALLPFAFWLVTRICRYGRPTDIFGLAVVYSLLILTHLPLTVIGSLSLLIYTITFFNRKNILQIGLKCALAVALGLLSSSFYWAMMISEMKFTNVSTDLMFSGIHNYASNFIFSFDFLTNPDAIERATWFADLILLATFVLQIPLIIISYVYPENFKKQLRRSLIPLLAVSVILTTPLSKIVWDLFPLLQKVQFPWRWLSVISMFGAVAAAAGYSSFRLLVKKPNLRFVSLLVIGGTALSIAFTFAQVIRPAAYLPREGFESAIKETAKAQSFDDYWTVWARKEAFGIYEKMQATDGKVEIISWEPERRVFNVSNEKEIVLRVATFYYPHWVISVRGNALNARPADDGSTLFNLPPQAGIVVMEFREPMLLHIANLISIAAWLVIALGLGLCLRFVKQI